MALFSWFIGNRNAKNIEKRNSQLDKKEDSFNLSTMWPTAKVRRNAIVKQHEFTNSSRLKQAQSQKVQLQEKES